MSIHQRIATPAAKQRYVRTLFATIADRYDLITVVLSYGQDRRWKRRLVDLAAPGRGTRALDLATGTGDIAFGLAAAGADVVGLDVTLRMIQLARKKTTKPGAAAFIVGDMLALPFPDRSFDVLTIGYGLRNVPDLDTAIAELFRVVRPGGRVLSLDFNRPTNRGVRMMYLAYLTLVGSALGWLLHRDPDTYRYIPASLRTYPGGAGVAAKLRSRGFVRVAHHPVLGGLMSIHVAHREPEI
jgi:demethylmenaquinone methyltransferase / 2-methoxy-6-polyprenyl-1,4-benzoquinol methylase